MLTSPHAEAAEFDAAQPFHIERVREFALLPHPLMVRRVNALAAEIGADFVVLDPAVPLGLIGPHLDLPYDVVLHGAEVTIPGRLPITRPLLARVLRQARQVIAAGSYPAAQGERAAGRPLPTVIVDPGVDTERFRPLSSTEILAARQHFGIDLDSELVVAVSRLVPRKGFDTLIRAAARLRPTRPRLQVVIAGAGRDRRRLETLAARLHAPVTFLGRVPHEDLPTLYGAADVFSMLCRNRWLGLEQEGFGIVFLEAAACAVPQIAGESGGAGDAVAAGETGVMINPPTDVTAVADALVSLLEDPQRRAQMGSAGRMRADTDFSYDHSARRLGDALGVKW